MPLYAEYAIFNQDDDIHLRDVADTKDKLAQSFQIGSAAQISRARLYLKKTGSPAGTLTVRIETDSAGDPSGTLAHTNATTTGLESALTTSYALIDFGFTRFELTADTTYWLVLSTDRGASGTDYISWGADTSSPAYSLGEMKSEQAAAWGSESADAVFSVLTPTLQRYNDYRIASGFDVALADMLPIENSFPFFRNHPFQVSGRGTYDPGIIRVRGDQLTTTTGIETVTWVITVLSIDQYTHWQKFYATGGEGQSGKVTIYTPVENSSFTGGGGLDNFLRINARFFLPSPATLEKRQGGYLNAEVRLAIDGESA
jgi:hypothetical protein